MSPLVNHGMIGSAMIWERRETTEQKNMFYHKNGIIEAAQKRKVEMGDAYTLANVCKCIALRSCFKLKDDNPFTLVSTQTKIHK